MKEGHHIDSAAVPPVQDFGVVWSNQSVSSFCPRKFKRMIVINKAGMKVLPESVLVIGVAVLLSLIVFFVNYGVAGPMIQADEGSYLANAAAIAGFRNDMASNYYAGYSLLISPAFLLGSDPHEIWFFVKLINSTLYLFIVIILWSISKKWKPSLAPWKRGMAVVLVSVYPMWVIMTGYSFSQIAFVLAYLIMVLLLSEAVYGKGYAWPVLGGVAGFLYWIHPTAVVAQIAICITLLYVALKCHWYKRFIIFLAVLVGVVVTYKIGIIPWLVDRMTISGQPAFSHYPSILELFLKLSSWSGFKRFVGVFGGHVFYLGVGTLGFIVLGLFAIKTMAFGHAKSGEISPEVLMLKASGLFLVLALVGIIVLSAVFMTSAVRLDHWMYGRYVEGFIAPVILAGVLSDSWRKSLWAIPVAALGAGLFAMGLDTYIHTAPFNVPTFWQEFFIRDKGILGWLLAGIAIVAIIGLLPQRISYFIAIVFFCFCSYQQIQYHNRDSKNAVSRWETAMMVREQFPSGACVGFDHSGINGYNRHIFWFDFGFVLFDYGLQRMSFEKWVDNCDGPLFSYDRHLHDRNPEIYPAAVSPHGGPILWVKGKPPVFDSNLVAITDRAAPLLMMLGDGWHSLERKHVWSSEKAVINLKKSMFVNAKWPSLIKLNIAPYAASKDRPVNIAVQAGGKQINFNYINSTQNTIEAPLACQPEGDMCKIEFLVENASSPKVLGKSPDSRVLGFALYSFSFE